MVTSRVIGGKDAKPGQWPWNVAVWRNGKFAACGGVLINSEFVLTSAACVANASPSDLKISVGELRSLSFYDRKIFLGKRFLRIARQWKNPS